MTDNLIDQIDRTRMLQPDLPTRPKMIRRMLEEWLAQHEGVAQND
ncbi:hypothetical protein [Loktanella fryxellensis]|nr:hypothetical protein [Loktanella fryxellensis]